MPPALEVLLAFARLGLTSFGGPVAHLGYFREEFVARRRWLDEAEYADLVALCSFLPGPASSQVGMGLGLRRAGWAGMLAAWLGFTLPSALLMVAFALGVARLGNVADAGWLHGLKLVAVAVVAQAVAGMARTLAPDAPRGALALGSAALVLAAPNPLAQIAALALAGLVGARFLKPDAAAGGAADPPPVSRRAGAVCLALCATLLILLPALRAAGGGPLLGLFDAFSRAGALVFGGGHVVLPLLEAGVVAPGWVSPDAFVAGYGAAQALPGPLFTFAAYLGAAADVGANRLLAALVALVGVFLPGALLVAGALPFWGALRARPTVRAALAGVNAAVVGVLLAALYTPVFTSAVRGPIDLAAVLSLYALLVHGRVAPWLVVALGAGAGALLGSVSGP